MVLHIEVVSHLFVFASIRVSDQVLRNPLVGELDGAQGDSYLKSSLTDPSLLAAGASGMRQSDIFLIAPSRSGGAANFFILA